MIHEILEQALVAFNEGNISSSIQLGEKLVNEHQSPYGFYILGLVYTAQENWELGYKFCYETFKYYPQFPDNLNRLGVSLCHLGKIQEGLNYFEMGMTIEGNYDEGNYCEQNYNYWKSRI